jgi:hypothetical protein
MALKVIWRQEHGENFATKEKILKNHEIVSLEKSTLLLIVLISLYPNRTTAGTDIYIKFQLWADYMHGNFPVLTERYSGK